LAFPGPTLINNLNLIATSPTCTPGVGNQPASTSTALTPDSTNDAELIQ
jgi:hypothetical protein